MFWCTNCLNTSTRPRITFDKNGLCNACQWVKEKKKINWKSRQSVLKKIFSNKKNNYDCIVPVSGGKDGSYVAYTLKKKFNINPLCVTIRPPLELELGNTNLRNFINAGFDHIHVSPNNKVMKDLNKIGFQDKGFPYYGWLISIFTSVLKIAVSMNIDLIVYAEDGEVEYGGSNLTKDKPFLMLYTQKKFILREAMTKY